MTKNIAIALILMAIVVGVVFSQPSNRLANTTWESINTYDGRHHTVVFGENSFRWTVPAGYVYLTGTYRVEGEAVYLSTSPYQPGSLIGDVLCLSYTVGSLATHSFEFRTSASVSVSALIKQGNEKYNRGDYDGAIADYTEAIRLDPNNALAYNNRGYTYALKGDYDQAIADTNTSLRIRPNDANTLHSRGYAYTGKGDYDRAIADFEAALKIDPNLAEAKRDLELAQQARGR